MLIKKVIKLFVSLRKDRERYRKLQYFRGGSFRILIKKFWISQKQGQYQGRRGGGGLGGGGGEGGGTCLK